MPEPWEKINLNPSAETIAGIAHGRSTTARRRLRRRNFALSKRAKANPPTISRIVEAMANVIVNIRAFCVAGLPSTWSVFLSPMKTGFCKYALEAVNEVHGGARNG